MHGRQGWGIRNVEGERWLEFAVSYKLVIGNTCLKKQLHHLIAYSSGRANTQTDYVLLWKNLPQTCEWCQGYAWWDHLTTPKWWCAIPKLTSFLLLKGNPSQKDLVPQDAEAHSDYQEAFIAERISINVSSGDTEEICGKAIVQIGAGSWRCVQVYQETTVAKCDLAVEWVDSAIKEKRRCWTNEERWQKGWISKGRVAQQINCFCQGKIPHLKDPSPSCSDLFHLANQMKDEKLGKKPVRTDVGELCLDDRAKQAAWKEHSKCLSNVEFNWDLDSITAFNSWKPCHPPCPIEWSRWWSLWSVARLQEQNDHSWNAKSLWWRREPAELGGVSTTFVSS